MAEDEEVAETNEEEGGKKKIPLWVFILIGGQLVVVAGLVAAFLIMSGGKSEPVEVEPTEAEQRADPSKVRDPATLIGPQFPLSPFVVNLLDDGRGPRFLQLELTFELENEEVRPELEGRVRQVRDELLMLLSAKRITDVETPDGKRILKDEIFTRINKILVTGRIRRVYFTDFVIQ
jgi:flagellar FliL protein